MFMKEIKVISAVDMKICAGRLCYFSKLEMYFMVSFAA